MSIIYRIEIEHDQPDEVDWQNYAVDALFEAFGTRRVEHIASAHGVDLTLDNSTYDANVRMSGPYGPSAGKAVDAPVAPSVEDVTQLIEDIATIITDGDKFDALAELANLRDLILGARGVTQGVTS